MNQAANEFQLIRTHRVDSLNVDIQEYRHERTGAPHIHLRSDNPENVFMVAFRTVPMDSTGVAHVLEHTALCGSRKYPVRDPFFMMIRRSLNTFMNAFTSSDWTAYPFASQNSKDFYNLLDVYLDATFFPQLNPLDFAQEGHRLAFIDDDSSKALEIRGIVYNEMKGAMSSPVSTLWQKLSEHLFPTTTYHYNSGGDPVHIPELTHDQLKQFHSRHYHPSNAVFMTFGNLDPAVHQQKFAETLSSFDSPLEPIRVGLEQRYTQPQEFVEDYDLPEGEEETAATHHVIGWLLGSSIDLMSAMEAQLLSAVLLDNSSSPLQHALETSNLGRSPSPLCGVDMSQREICFACGLEGSEPDRADAVEQLVLETLERIAREGVPHEDVESCLHQLELQQREISGDSYPYGLQLMLTALSSATHGGDPLALLDLDPVLSKLRDRIKDPSYIPTLCQQLLLENPHRVRLTLKPEATLAQKRDAELQDKLAKIAVALSDEDKQKILAQTRALAQRQSSEDDPSVLPAVTLADVPVDAPYPKGKIHTGGTMPVTSYGVGTNGLVYQMLVSELPALDDNEQELLPLLTHLITEVGVGSDDYLEVQRRQAAVCGSISTSYQLRGSPMDAQDVRGYLFTSGKALYRNQQSLTDLMQETLISCRFDESARIRELVAQARARTDASISGHGHALAMQAAAQYFSPVNYLNQRTGGLTGIRALRQLDKGIDDKKALQQLLEALAALHQKILQQHREWVVISEPSCVETYATGLQNSAKFQGDASAPLRMQPMHPRAADQLWLAGTQVNFCARAYPTVTTDHPDAPALTALGGLLRNLYLHPAIRERGGAYGGGASQDNNNGVFRFFSYRDPRLSDTLDDFDRAVEIICNDAVESRFVEEALLGVISSLDKPGSPAGEARSAFSGALFGRTQDVRDRFRQRLLAVDLPELREVAGRYLIRERASTAVVSNSNHQDQADKLGLEICKL